MTKNKKTKKSSPKTPKWLNQKISFFTGSLIVITTFVIAASAIPSYKKDNQSALEVLFTTFIEDSDLHEAHIEAENFRIEIYKKELDRARESQETVLIQE